MWTNLETADRIAKIILALGVIATFITKLISGPVALGLAIVALVVIAFEVGKIILALISRD